MGYLRKWGTYGTITREMFRNGRILCVILQTT